MVRSFIKGPFLFQQKNKVSLQIKKERKKFGNIVYKQLARNNVVIPALISSFLETKNGKNTIRFRILEEMVGHKVGEFAITRKRFVEKKKRFK